MQRVRNSAGVGVVAVFSTLNFVSYIDFRQSLCQIVMRRLQSAAAIGIAIRRPSIDAATAAVFTALMLSPSFESRILALCARHAKHGIRSGSNASGCYAGPGRAKKTAIV